MKYYLSVAAIVKNEAEFLDEWICFNLLQGVEHFFIYENDSIDETLKILKKYEQKGIVTLERIHGLGKQFEAYEKFLRDHSDKTTWCAVLDVDEFLYADKKLPEFLKEYENFSALAVHWYLYGSRETPGDLVIERFCYRDSKINPHVKSIIQPAKVISKGKDSHTFYVKTPAVNENKVYLPKNYATKSPLTANRIRINHYHVKSYEEFVKRKSIPRASTGTFIKDIDESFKHHDKNEIYDSFSSDLIKGVKELRGRYK